MKNLLYLVLLSLALLLSTSAKAQNHDFFTHCQATACTIGSDDDITFEERGAADPTVDGNVEWDTTSETLKIGDDGAGTHEFFPGAHVSTLPGFQIIIPEPDIADEFVIMLPPFPGTMIRVDCEAFGGTSVTINLCDGEDLGDDTCTTSILGDVLICTTSPTPDTTLSATGFVARDKVTLVLTAEDGAVDSLNVTLTVTVD